MKIYIGGTHMGGSGYPNAIRTISILKEQPDLEIIECGTWLSDTTHLWKITQVNVFSKASIFIKLILCNLISFFEILIKTSISPAPVYIPYPSVFLLWFLSWVPHQFRPYTIADAYISIWDSMYLDRKNTKKKTSYVFSGIVKSLENRALKAANLILVDTEANKTYFEEIFKLKKDKVISIPLAIDESLFLKTTTYVKEKLTHSNEQQIVLFVGTLIPLHGIATILQAIETLLPNINMHFRFIGEGQQSYLIEKFLNQHNPENFSWLKGWTSIEQISKEIANSDICLGVFGGAEKASRVLPFKLYMYMAAGRAVISQARLSVPLNCPTPPIKFVDPNDAAALSESISLLVQSKELRAYYSKEAKEYYQDFLSNSVVAQKWQEILRIYNDNC